MSFEGSESTRSRWQKGLCRYDLVKDFEMKRLSWVTLVGPKASKWPLQEGGGRVRVREGDRRMAAEVGVM